MNLNDIRHADVVVLGRILNYRIVEDQQTRQDRRVLEANWPGLSLEEQQRRARQTSFLPDYARFDIAVEDVLVGTAGRVLTVSWDNSTFGEPRSMPAGRYLVALRRSGGVAPPLRGPSATISPDPHASAMVPVQAPCSRAFIFEEATEQAREVRAILSRR
ncbi:MAG TPA: hypothetical protein VMG08_15475 [Allosphingosinicella sp.]|nr:hypothetical protein [Allosphingosinicella sp.]